MGPKRTRAKTPAPRTAAASRTRRGQAATYETPIDVDAIGTAREDLYFVRQSDGTVRANSGGPASGTHQQQQTGSTSENASGSTIQQSEEQQQDTGSAGQRAQDIAAQQHHQAGSTGQGHDEQREQASGQVTSSGPVTDENNDGATSLATGNGETKEEGESGEHGQANGESKRRRSSCGSRQDSPKKPKTGEGSGQAGDAGGESQRQEDEGKESCGRLQQFLTIYRGLPLPHPDPTPHNTTIQDEDVYRGVVAVTEAISRKGCREFSFIDWKSFHSSLFSNREAMRQTVARPGNEMLVPWIDHGHHSLFYLQRHEDAGQFQVLHFDSAQLYGHRPTRNTHAIRQRLQRVNWTGEGAAGDGKIPLQSSNVDVVRQQGRTQCGLHVIFNAWALALGLRIARTMDRQRFRDFYTDGKILIQQAVQGNVSSKAIWAFFDCYEFIEAGQKINASRSFLNTVPIRGEHGLRMLTARMRIQQALPEGLEFDLAAAEIAPGESDFSALSTDDFLRRLQNHQAAIAAGFPTAGARHAGQEGDGIDL